MLEEVEADAVRRPSKRSRTTTDGLVAPPQPALPVPDHSWLQPAALFGNERTFEFYVLVLEGVRSAAVRHTGRALSAAPPS